MPIRIALILSMLLLIGADATRPATTEPSDAVPGLIAQLGTSEFGVREQAEEKLSAMGPAIEPQLRQALNSNLSDEARTRLNDLLSRLDEAMALHARVTMHYTDAPVKKILDDFAAQAGGDLGVGDPPVATFTQGRVASVDLDNADFWQALRAVSDASGLKPWIGQSGLTLAPEIGRAIMQIDFSSPYAQSSGGLFFVPRDCNETRTIRYEANQRFSNMALVIDVVPEPKLHVLGAMGMNWLKECVDEKGNSLVAPEFARRANFPLGMMNVRGPRQAFWPIAANLRDVPGMGTKIARLRGELPISVQTRSQIFEIDDITHARDLTKSDGQMNVTVLGCSRMNLNYRVDLACTGIGMNMAEQSIQDLMNSIEIVDDQGQIISRQSVIPQLRVINGGGVPQTINLTIIFQPTQNTPAKLRWETTLEQKRLSVPFELHDIPLP